MVGGIENRREADRCDNVLGSVHAHRDRKIRSMPSADRKAVQMTPAKPRVMIYEERNRNGEQKKQLNKKKTSGRRKASFDFLPDFLFFLFLS